jgi:hypothetical protein
MYIVGNKKLDITPEEKKYLDYVEKSLGKNIFVGLFESDKDGIIITITPSPSEPIHMIVLFALLNVMLNQRLRKTNNSELTERIKKLEEEILLLKKDKG